LEQAKKRAEIRIREARAKPIDILAMNMRLANEADKVEEEVDLEVDLDEPYTIFDVSTLVGFTFKLTTIKELPSSSQIVI
jgi:hypothetical protein